MDLYAEDENYRRAVDNMVADYVCPHCSTRQPHVLMGGGGRRVLVVTHERGCPDHEDFGGDSAA